MWEAGGVAAAVSPSDLVPHAQIHVGWRWGAVGGRSRDRPGSKTVHGREGISLTVEKDPALHTGLCVG